MTPDTRQSAADLSASQELKRNVGLRLSFYPTRLTDDDLAQLGSMAICGCNYAPQFSYWLVELLQAEQLRRLQRGPVERCELPLCWTGRDLARALDVAVWLTGRAESYGALRFAEAVLDALIAIAGVQLESLR